MTDKDVVITLKDDDGNVVIIPVTPKEITLGYGSATSATVSILDMGQADYGKGQNLDAYSWSSFFPGRFDRYYCNSQPDDPEEYSKQLNKWKKNATKIRMIIPEIGVNEAVKVASYTGKYKGADMDFYYDIKLNQSVKIKCITVAAKVVKVEEPRPALPVDNNINKGDKVHFNGGPVYYSSNTPSPTVTRGAADCNCTSVYNGTHSIHLIHYSGDRVYGWVDKANCTKL